MSLIHSLKTLPLYFEYFLKVADQHSLQAPFIFDFYTNLIKGIKRNVGIEEIEVLRTSFLNDHSKVRGKDLGAGSRVAKSECDKTVSTIARYGISSKRECIFLSELAKKIQANTCIELGTSLGIATSYLAKSNQLARIYTFEGNETLVKKSRDLFSKLNCTNIQLIHGDIDIKLPSQLAQLDKVDFAIIDANHTYNALLLYFNLLKTKMSDTGVMVIDDIRWSLDMYRGWKNLISDEGVTISIEFLNKGLLFFGQHIQKQHYILSC